MPFDQRSLIHREAWFPPCFVRQNQSFFFSFSVWQFYITSKLKCSNLRSLLSITFPQGFRISKNIGHPTSGSGSKKTVKPYLKIEQTDRQTHTQTHIWTFRLIESIGPEGRCFENKNAWQMPSPGYQPNQTCRTAGEGLLTWCAGLWARAKPSI